MRGEARDEGADEYGKKRCKPEHTDGDDDDHESERAGNEKPGVVRRPRGECCRWIHSDLVLMRIAVSGCDYGWLSLYMGMPSGHAGVKPRRNSTFIGDVSKYGRAGYFI